jgi:hypothetical protein
LTAGIGHGLLNNSMMLYHTADLLLRGMLNANRCTRGQKDIREDVTFRDDVALR